MPETSYPIAALAREFNLDYGLVLNCAEDVRRDAQPKRHIEEAYMRIPAEFVYSLFLDGLNAALKKYGTQHARY